jgi:hypothetical protein
LHQNLTLEEMSTSSVIVPALNEEGYIGSLLSDLAAQSRRPEEVLVVDAGSVDSTVQIARQFPFVQVLAGAPPVAEGRNLEGRKAKGDVLIFLDADVRLCEGFLEGFLEEFEARHLDVACPLSINTRSPRRTARLREPSGLGPSFSCRISFPAIYPRQLQGKPVRSLIRRVRPSSCARSQP